MTTLAARLAAAVRERRVVRFRYLGSGAAGERVCHPHVLFENADGDLLLDAVQAGGPSGSGAATRWRTFDLVLIRDLTVLTRRFTPDPGLNLDSPKYHRIRAHCLPRGPAVGR